MIYLKFSISVILILLYGCKKNPVDPPVITEPDSTSHNIIWNIDTIGGFMNTLQDVWGTGHDNVYAVGFIQFSDYSDTSLWATNIMHWNGTKWSPVNFVEGYLNCITGFNKNDIWAAGTSLGYAFFVHFNGREWKSERLEKYPSIRQIWGATWNKVYAVGLEGCILKYDGTRWLELESGTTLDLNDIWGTSPTDIYAVGGDDSKGIGIMLHYDGHSWTTIYESTSQDGKPSGYTSTIWGLTKDKMYLNCGSGEFIGSIDHWEDMYTPDDNTYIEAIRGDSYKNIFLVGHFGLIIHWNGKSWKRYDQFYKKPYGDILYSVWSKEDVVFVVGFSQDAKPVVYRGKMIY